ncbi:hypothetical protein LI328DRAFT_41578 [Trichoderma asperelloides]|nr:hypothetical protein LI328DRAFT_41578 [Trichoderma asperelloides]
MLSTVAVSGRKAGACAYSISASATDSRSAMPNEHRCLPTYLGNLISLLHFFFFFFFLNKGGTHSVCCCCIIWGIIWMCPRRLKPLSLSSQDEYGGSTWAYGGNCPWRLEMALHAWDGEKGGHELLVNRNLAICICVSCVNFTKRCTMQR